MARKEKRERNEGTDYPDREKIRNAVAALKGLTRPKKGGERICTWDEKENRLVFEKGGARRLRDLAAAKKYVEKNGYRLG
jgi:hypothetical protein